MAEADKIFVVSGASRGLGFALAEHYSRTATVIGLSRSGTGPKNCISMACDLRNPDQIRSTVEEIVKKHSGIHMLINSAAVLKSAPFLLTHDADIQEMISVNFAAAIYLSKAVLRPMITQKAGRIVNIVSMSHRVKKPGDAVYAATKSALEVFAQILNQEVHSQGITVNNIGLSAMPTGMLAPLVKDDPEKIKKIIPHGHYATLESVVHCIDTFHSEKSSDIGGQTIYLGGISA